MKSLVGLTRPFWLFCPLALLGSVVVVDCAPANPWVPLVNPINPGPSSLVPGITRVPGKDFSDVRDRNAAGAADPEQDVAWDGSGGVRDSFDYSGTRLPPLNQDIEVDGIAAGGDALFQALRSNQAALLFSVETDPEIIFERDTGASGVWATALDIDAMNPPLDTDGLEVWGGDNNDDSDRYSLAGDPALPGIGKIAVWAFTPLAGPSNPHTLTSALASAMDLQFGGDGNDAHFSNLVELMDVDAIMTFGSQITYSIRPLEYDIGVVAPNIIRYDGGEIFEFDGPGVPTRYLNHGGHLWDTLFDVRGTFGLNHENVDAIEAVAGVPEPSSIALFLLGLLAASRCVIRRR